MSSDDCFELGRQSYVNRDYYHTVLWMNEAMVRMLEEPHNQTQSFTRADVLEYLAFSTYKQGKYMTWRIRRMYVRVHLLMAILAFVWVFTVVLMLCLDSFA